MSQTTATQTTQETKSTPANQFSLTGYLGQNPEVLTFSSGNSLTKISVAIREPGSEKPNWYQVILWNQVGKTAAKYTKKGSKVTVKGEMRFDTWTDKVSGEERSALKLHVNDVFGLDLHRTKADFAEETTAPVPAPKTISQPVPVTAPIEVDAEAISDEDWEKIAF